MARMRNRMNQLQKEIDDFVRDNQDRRRSIWNFLSLESNDLTKKLYELLIDIGGNREIDRQEGTDWFMEQTRKLIDWTTPDK
jgi:hypothetical protein